MRQETHIFLDECHLLLQEIIDPDDVVFMIEEPDNRLWSSSELDEQIKTYLGRRHDDFNDVMQDIHDNIISLDKELSLVAQETTETTTSKRIKGAIDVTHHKSKWLSKIDNISELNQDLKRLRKTAKQIRHAKPKVQKQDTKQIPTYYEYLSPYTKSFYQALTQNWSCSQSRHIYHDLALFLGQAGETVDFLMRQRSVSGFKTITPWWRSYWSLENVYYFPSNNDDANLAKSLQTLHLSAEIDSRQAMRDESWMSGRLSPAEPQDAGEAQLLYGIRNLALYSLGVALLQIDRWSTMNADDVVAIRRLARQTSRLGPRFQEVVQKCVDCDFGQGDDLEKPMLRNAVYGSVICEIEDLIRRISEK
ncbi:hypothetical protein KJ359_011079 [Pestalotiopsis sp. 9143b]|nr:hypothetical protein KJ359_011079 [Pestalotiopsis sp. 9143b]